MRNDPILIGLMVALMILIILSYAGIQEERRMEFERETKMEELRILKERGDE